MAEGKYRRALQESIREYERLSAQRAAIDTRIAQLVQAIGSLSRLCNLTPTVGLGLTDACRMVLKAAGHPLTAAEVRIQLDAMGFDTSRYSNPLASIHIVLRRLSRAGEVGFVPRSHDKPAYAWKRPARVVVLSKSSDIPKFNADWMLLSDRNPKEE
jgi:hypothetical protein